MNSNNSIEITEVFEEPGTPKVDFSVPEEKPVSIIKDYKRSWYTTIDGEYIEISPNEPSDRQLLYEGATFKIDYDDIGESDSDNEMEEDNFSVETLPDENSSIEISEDMQPPRKKQRLEEDNSNFAFWPAYNHFLNRYENNNHNVQPDSFWKGFNSSPHPGYTFPIFQLPKSITK